MTNLFQTGYRNLQYIVKAFLWQPKTPEQEGLIDRLRKYHISLSSLNYSLDTQNIPLSVGRFPELLDLESNIIPQIDYHLEIIANGTSKRDFTLEDRARIMSEYVSQKIADNLATNPRTFKRVFQGSKD